MSNQSDLLEFCMFPHNVFYMTCLILLALAGTKGLGEDTLRESLLFLETKVRTSPAKSSVFLPLSEVSVLLLLTMSGHSVAGWLAPVTTAMPATKCSYNNVSSNTSPVWLVLVDFLVK